MSSESREPMDPEDDHAVPNGVLVEAEDAREEAAREATAAVQLGLYISAARCIFTYVIAPALGALGVVLGPLGLILQIFGGVMATIGARRLWRLKHRMRIPYALVALAVDALAIWALVELINNWRS